MTLLQKDIKNNFQGDNVKISTALLEQKSKSLRLRVWLNVLCRSHLQAAYCETCHVLLSQVWASVNAYGSFHVAVTSHG